MAKMHVMDILLFGLDGGHQGNGGRNARKCQQVFLLHSGSPPDPQVTRPRAHSAATKSTIACAAWSRFCSQVRPDCLRGLKL